MQHQLTNCYLRYHKIDLTPWQPSSSSDGEKSLYLGRGSKVGAKPWGSSREGDVGGWNWFIHNCFGNQHTQNYQTNRMFTLCISQFQAPTSPPGLTPREFFKVVKFPAPGQKIVSKLRPWGKKIDKNLAPGDNFVDLQDNFAMIVKPFAFFCYSSLAWLSSSFFKDHKACECKISQR